MVRTLVGVVEEGDALEEAQPLDVHGVEVDEQVRQHQEVDHHDGRDEDAGPGFLGVGCFGGSESGQYA